MNNFNNDDYNSIWNNIEAITIEQDKEREQAYKDNNEFIRDRIY
jgi:hypothetical protein